MPKRNSFIVGFVCALLSVAAFYVWQGLAMSGGVEADSPDGMYNLLISAPLSPEIGGAYDIRLIDKQSSTKVRQVTVSLPSTEETVSVRDGGGAVVWDANGSFADIHVSGQPLIRIWVP